MSSNTTMACCVADDRERAVKEVAQVYERIKIQQPLLHCCSSPSTATHQMQLAQSLLGDALRALNVALSVINQPAAAAAADSPVTATRSVVKSEPQRRLSRPSPASADSQPTETTPRRAKKRRSSVMEQGQHQKLSWVDFTTVPYEDGYEWRKYGEKKINGTAYTRSYFRCTYKDDTGCIATKHIQQMDSSSDDPPMFQVTYNNKHTCNNTCTNTTAANSSEGVMMTINNPDLNGHAAIVKQEPPVLPPLIEASALPFDQMLPIHQQEPLLFPVSMLQQLERDFHGNIPSTSSSCISGESFEEMGQTMLAEEEASAEDDPFCDFELLRFLCNSFREY